MSVISLVSFHGLALIKADTLRYERYSVVDEGC